MQAHEERRRATRATRPRPVAPREAAGADPLAGLRPAGNAAISRALRQGETPAGGDGEAESATSRTDRFAAGMDQVNQSAAVPAHANLYGLGPGLYIASSYLDKPGPAHQTMDGFLGGDAIDGASSLLGTVGNAAHVHQSRKQLNSESPQKPLPAATKYRTRRTLRTEGQSLGTNMAGVADDATFAANHTLKHFGHMSGLATDATGEAAGGIFALGSAVNVGRVGRSLVRTRRMRRRVNDLELGPTGFDGTQRGAELLRRQRELTERQERLPEMLAAQREELEMYGPEVPQRVIGQMLAAIERTEQEMPRVERELAAVTQEREQRRAEYEQVRGQLESDRDYTVMKQGRRMAKDGVSLVGNFVKIGSGVVIILIGAAALSSPAGWALAVAATVTVGLLGGYKALKAIRKRYHLALEAQTAASSQEAAEGQGEGTVVQDKSAAFREALKFWKSLGTGIRHRHAEALLDVAGGVRGEPEQAREAQEFLKALNLGPEHLGREHRTHAWSRLRGRRASSMTEEDWKTALKDPEQKADWVEMIANRMRS